MWNIVFNSSCKFNRLAVLYKINFRRYWVMVKHTISREANHRPCLTAEDLYEAVGNPEEVLLC